MGVLQPHDQQRSQSADELQTKPREGLCGMLHITSIHSPEAGWVTEQCSGNITKTLLNFCLSHSACPFIFPSLSRLVCTLLHSLFSHPTPPPCVRASWVCYSNPTVVTEFVSLTKGPTLYTCQRANDSNKHGSRRRGGQAKRCSVELHWVLGCSSSLETQEPTICLFDVWRYFGFDGNLKKEITCCFGSVATGR